jgi:hypothetical protein
MMRICSLQGFSTVHVIEVYLFFRDTWYIKDYLIYRGTSIELLSVCLTFLPGSSLSLYLSFPLPDVAVGLLLLAENSLISAETH